MTVETLNVLGVVVIVLSCLAGGSLWERHRLARFLPLIAIIAMGFAYFPLLGVKPSGGQLAEMVLGMALAGAIINGALWIACRETKKSG